MLDDLIAKRTFCMVAAVAGGKEKKNRFHVSAGYTSYVGKFNWRGASVM